MNQASQKRMRQLDKRFEALVRSQRVRDGKALFLGYKLDPNDVNNPIRLPVTRNDILKAEKKSRNPNRMHQNKTRAVGATGKPSLKKGLT